MGGSLNILWHCFLGSKMTFSVPVATAEVSKFAGVLSAALSQHHLLEFEILKFQLNWNSISSISFVHSDTS